MRYVKTNSIFTPETVKKSKYPLFDMLRRIFCRHEYGWYKNIYGDEINIVSTTNTTYRSWWVCNKCGKWETKKNLYKKK